MKRLLLILILTITASLESWAQHIPITSSYMYSGLYINPAYAGSRNTPQVDLLHRQQWLGIEGAPSTTIVSGEFMLKNEQVGLGGMLYQDRIGSTNRTGIQGAYSYNINFGKNRLALGLSVSLDMYRQQWLNVVTTSTEVDPNFQTNFTTTLPNVGFGAYYFGKKFFVGFSNPFVFNLSYTDSYQPTAVLDFSESNFLVEGGYVVKVSDNVNFKPSVLIKTIPARYVQLDVNGLIEINKKYGAGISYRNSTNLIMMLFAKLNNNFTVSYAYDYALRKNRTFLTGSHEIYLRYQFRKVLKVENPRYF